MAKLEWQRLNDDDGIMTTAWQGMYDVYDDDGVTGVEWQSWNDDDALTMMASRPRAHT